MSYQYRNEYIKKNYKRLNLALDPDIYAKLLVLQKRYGMSRTQIIEMMVDNLYCKVIQ